MVEGCGSDGAKHAVRLGKGETRCQPKKSRAKKKKKTRHILFVLLSVKLEMNPFIHSFIHLYITLYTFCEVYQTYDLTHGPYILK